MPCPTFLKFQSLSTLLHNSQTFSTVSSSSESIFILEIEGFPSEFLLNISTWELWRSLPSKRWVESYLENFYINFFPVYVFFLTVNFVLNIEKNLLCIPFIQTLWLLNRHCRLRILAFAFTSHKLGYILKICFVNLQSEIKPLLVIHIRYQIIN